MMLFLLCDGEADSFGTCSRCGSRVATTSGRCGAPVQVTNERITLPHEFGYDADADAREGDRLRKEIGALRAALEDTCAWIERVACEVDEEHGVVIPGCIAQCQMIGMALDATKGDGDV